MAGDGPEFREEHSPAGATGDRKPDPSLRGHRTPTEFRLLAELKRRNVFRVGATYLGSAWLIVHVSTVLGETFESLHRAMPVIIGVLVAVLPLALVGAWFFERTATGFSLTHRVERSVSIRETTARQLELITMAVLALAILAMLLDRWVLHRPTDETLVPVVAVVLLVLLADRLIGRRLSAPPAAHSAVVAATGAGMQSPPSIAVLPFANLTNEPEKEYFSDGLAEEILNALSQVEDLRVASRSSAFSFKGKAIEIGEIATKLHVANVLEGSVRRAGNRVRVTVQLIDASNGFQLWSERYDRQMEDIFEIQDEIARSITDHLRVTLGGGTKRSTANLEAYELYLKGRYNWHQRSPATLRAAIQCFEQSIKLDAEYALAYAGLADCYSLLRMYGWVSAEAGRPPAQAAVRRAMTVAPSLWETNFSRAFYTFSFERAWRAAEPYFEKAIAINPRSSLAQMYYAMFLTTAGRAADAITHTGLACQLDPLSPLIYSLSSAVLSALGRFEAAERAAQHALDLQPDYVAGLWVRGVALCGLGRNAEAVESLERTVTLARAPIFVGILGFGYARAGRHEDAMRLLRELDGRRSSGEYVPAFTSLYIHLGLGDVPEIREALSKTVAEAAPPFTTSVMCGPFLEPFRADSEIERFLHFELSGW
jgi:TolB-like protein